MEDTYYKVDYTVYNGPNIIDTGKDFLIRSTSPLSPDEQADLVAGYIGKAKGDVRITAGKMITKDEYVASGGKSNPPWLGPLGPKPSGGAGQ